MATIEKVQCPMLNKSIDLAYCIELQMMANDEIEPTEDEMQLTENDFAICKGCEKQECPTPDYVEDK